jgi:hypothetical protein
VGYLEELAGYLEGLYLGTLNMDLFIGKLTNEPDACTVLAAGPGMPGHRTHDVPGEAMQRPGVDIVVRGTSDGFAAAMQQAHAVWEALTQVTNMTLGSTRYQAVEPLTPPRQQGFDPHDRPLIGFRSLVTKEPS